MLNDAAGIDAGGMQPPIDLNVSTRANMSEVLEFVFHNKAMVNDDFVELSYTLHLERGDGPTISSVLETILAPDEKLDNRLSELQAPTLLLWGARDALTPLAMAENFQRLIPGSRLEVIPECGHIPCLEKPAEFVQAVSHFLRQ